jgi:putative ABC transport system permease protein
MEAQMIGVAFVIAFAEIRRNAMRASLTMLGIVIGVGAVIAMVTLGNGAQAGIAASIGSLGRNLIILAPGQRRGPGGPSADAPPFDVDDAEAIKRSISGARYVAPVSTRAEIAVFGNRNHTTQVTGTDNDYFGAREWQLASGRNFSDLEIRAGRAVCVIGQTIRTELFGSQNPLGSNIRIGQIPCEVIGILEAKGRSTFGQDQDDLVLAPLRAVQRRLAGSTSVGTVWIAANRPEDVQKVEAEINTLMRERRRLPSGTPDDFQANDMQQIAGIMEATTGILTAFLAAIAAVSLLVGGIGIMNIMLVSVTERTREIGIRLAVGARERDVLTQFLVEAIVMSGLGGIVGIVLGLSASAFAVRFLNIPFVPSPGIVVLAFTFSVGIGVAFGYFPAQRAARMDPIQALRHE